MAGRCADKWDKDYASTTMIPSKTDQRHQRRFDGILLTPGNAAQEDLWRTDSNGTNVWLRWQWGPGWWWRRRRRPLVEGGGPPGGPSLIDNKEDQTGGATGVDGNVTGRATATASCMVQANVGRKLVKSNKITRFLRWLMIRFRHSIERY
jgi:hypothetical protein